MSIHNCIHQKGNNQDVCIHHRSIFLASGVGYLPSLTMIGMTYHLEHHHSRSGAKRSLTQLVNETLYAPLLSFFFPSSSRLRNLLYNRKKKWLGVRFLQHVRKPLNQRLLQQDCCHGDMESNHCSHAWKRTLLIPCSAQLSLRKVGLCLCGNECIVSSKPCSLYK